MIKPFAVTVLLIGLLIISANAATLSSAFTNSHLVSHDSELSVMRTISDNKIITPDLNFKSDGIITTNALMGDASTSEIDQGLYFKGGKNQYYNAFSSLSSHINAKNVLDVRTSLSGTSRTIVSGSSDLTIDSTISGLSIASPGSPDYSFSLAGGHNTVTNAVPWGVRIPKEDLKEYSVSLDVEPLDLDQPADLFNQDVKLNFNVIDNDLAYYGYDFSRELEIGDINCKSEMELIHREIYSGGEGYEIT